MEDENFDADDILQQWAAEAESKDQGDKADNDPDDWETL